MQTSHIECGPLTSPYTFNSSAAEPIANCLLFGVTLFCLDGGTLGDAGNCTVTIQMCGDIAHFNPLIHPLNMHQVVISDIQCVV